MSNSYHRLVAEMKSVTLPYRRDTEGVIRESLGRASRRHLLEVLVAHAIELTNKENQVIALKKEVSRIYGVDLFKEEI